MGTWPFRLLIVWIHGIEVSKNMHSIRSPYSRVMGSW